MQTKYIFVTGGVVSGLGKGITAASLGRLLKARGLKVTIQKFDPYINFDPGTMSPYQHGEVFVTEDGGETDLDLGHYERFIDENLTIDNNITAGKIYWSVINKEREGEFAGATVQVIPHITNAIKEHLYKGKGAIDADIVITEIGGTVGDMESQPFLEAIRQASFEVGRDNAIFIHVTLIPYLSKSGEMKTKPTQHSVKQLLSLGIQPDIIVCRTEREMSTDMKEKLALFCNVEKDCVIQNMDLESLYEVPLLLERENLANIVCKKLNMQLSEPVLNEWERLVERQKNITDTVTIALVGKYVELHDAYLSIVEALKHGGIHNDADVCIKWVNSAQMEGDIKDILGDADGILVPGGFDKRGVEGKISALKYARENKIPALGICLGMHCAVIEFARNVLGLEDANSSEMDGDTKNPVIDLMPDQKEKKELGGTIRKGAYPCRLNKQSKAYEMYNEEEISERHRHRYEFNNEYRSVMEKNGLMLVGMSPDSSLVEVVELKKELHPWFIGVQFHPEFKSRPNKPHPLFKGFVEAAKTRADTE